MKIKLLLLALIISFFNLNAQVVFQDHIIAESNLLDMLQFVDIGDLDGDGDMDILTSSDGDSKIAWYENTDGQGNFGPQQVISTNGGGYSAYAVDLNGDGNTDVLAVEDNKKIFWYENDGSENFGTKHIIEDFMMSLVAAYPFDADGDGDMDVISKSAGDPVTGIPGKIAWYENDGQGGFGFYNTIANLSWEFAIQVTDLDTDSDMDVIASQTGVGVIWYENTDGQGNYSNSQNIPSIDGPFINSGDVDGDGDMDIVSSDYDEIVWHENTDGLGSFGTPQMISSLGAIDSHSVDVDGDGDTDLLSSSSYSEGIIWYENSNGLGNFIAQPAISDNVHALSGDLDADGDMDVVSWSFDKVVWQENTDGTGNFGAAQMIITTTNYEDIFPEDIDNDGDIDVLFASSPGRKIGWYGNMDGQGNYSSEQNITINADGASSVYSEDLDGDGDKDVLSASFNDNKIAWYENIDGIGNFGTQQIISENAEGAKSVFAADMDGDGDIDVLSASLGLPIAGNYPGQLAFYKNDGQENFDTEQIIITTDDGATFIYAIDIDSDGELDILSAIVENNVRKIVWFKNDGQGNFGTAQTIALGSIPIYPTDIDGDNDIDILTTTNDDKIVWYPNNGQGVFGTQNEIAANADYAYSIFAVDIEADGDLDVLSTSFYDGNISLYENTDGQENFGAKQIISTNAGGAIMVCAADVNEDNRMDVLSAAIGIPEFPNQDKITWHENMGLASINESSFEFFFLYPNPTSGILQISSKTPIKEMEVHNSLGQFIFSTDQNQIDLSKLSNGIYFLKITGENGNSETKKIIKK